MLYHYLLLTFFSGFTGCFGCAFELMKEAVDTTVVLVQIAVDTTVVLVQIAVDTTVVLVQIAVDTWLLIILLSW